MPSIRCSETETCRNPLPVMSSGFECAGTVPTRTVLIVGTVRSSHSSSSAPASASQRGTIIRVITTRATSTPLLPPPVRSTPFDVAQICSVSVTLLGISCLDSPPFGFPILSISILALQVSVRFLYVTHRAAMMPHVFRPLQQPEATLMAHAEALAQAEALLAGVLAAAKAALPKGLDVLVWGASRVGDQATLRHLLANGGGSSWTPSTDDELWGRDTCLRVASRFGHEGAVKQLLESGVDVDEVRTDDGATALCVAAQEGHEGVVEQLLKAEADVNKARTDYGATPLLITAYEGHEGVVEKLLKAGADVNKARTDHGATPLYTAAYGGHEGVVEQLLKAEADVNKARTDDGATPLYTAAFGGHEGVVEQLLKAEADVNKAATDDGATPLYIAAAEGHEGVVEKLLKAEADVNKATTDDGTTALYIAAQEGHEGVVEKLLKAEADVNKARTDYGTTALYIAAQEGHEGVVEKLLKAGADPNTGTILGAYRYPLSIASYCGHSKICSLLLEARANVNHANGNEGPALKTAVTRGHREVALVLVEHGASDNTLTQPMLKDMYKWTAEALKENKRAMAEKNKQMEEMVQGIPEWCAQAASAVAAEGQNDGSSSGPAQP